LFLKVMRQILVNHFFGKLAGRYTKIPTRPKMLAPVSFLYVGKFIENLAGCSTFDPAHYFRGRECWRSRNEHVDMIFTHHPSQNLYFKHSTGLFRQVSHTKCNVSDQHLIAIFGYPNKVIFDFVFRVRPLTIFHLNHVNQLLAESKPAESRWFQPLGTDE
jgi:hypothetical protein